VSEPSPIVERLIVEPLTAQAFAPFGEVIETASAKQVYAINEGTAQRFHDLAQIDVGEGGRTLVSVFRAQPRKLPFAVRMLERHPLGTQTFVPLDPSLRYLVVVGESPEATPRAFFVDQGRGINLRRGAWHHPLIALDQISDFLVIDRGGAGHNCDEVQLPRSWSLAL
jgi:ureidoglycolate lyase